MQYRIPAELHRAARVVATARGMTLRQFVIESLTAEVEREYASARDRAGAGG